VIPVSALSPTGASALPQIDPSALPPEVRKGTPEQQQAYRAALGFERMLVRQLVESMTTSAEAVSGEDESESAATGTYKEMWADSLADNVARGGGLGLARDLYTSLQGALK
jgi:Rod binding domain-containing protein